MDRFGVCVCVGREREKREVQLGLISLVPVHFFHPLLERIFISGTCFYVARAPLNEREKLSLSTTSCRIPCFVSTKGEGLDIDSFFFSLSVYRVKNLLFKMTMIAPALPVRLARNNCC